MKCQILFSRKNVTNLSSAESAHCVVNVKCDYFYDLWGFSLRLLMESYKIQEQQSTCLFHLPDPLADV